MHFFYLLEYLTRIYHFKKHPRLALYEYSYLCDDKRFQKSPEIAILHLLIE